MSENWESRWKDYYQILQVHPTAEQEVIQAAYNRLARKYHPDVNPGTSATKKMADINEAFEVLGNLERRRLYHPVWLQKRRESDTSRSETRKRSPSDEGTTQQEGPRPSTSAKTEARNVAPDSDSREKGGQFLTLFMIGALGAVMIGVGVVSLNDLTSSPYSPPPVSAPTSNQSPSIDSPSTPTETIHNTDQGLPTDPPGQPQEPIPSASPEVPETTARVLFTDDFSDSTSGWLVYRDERGWVEYSNGALSIFNFWDVRSEYTTWSFAPGLFTDFVLEVEAQWIGGSENNEIGIFVRYRYGGDHNFYYLAINPLGYFYITAIQEGSERVIIEPTYSNYIHGQMQAVNRIRVECIGNVLKMSVNDHLLAETRDDLFRSGGIGLGVSWMGQSNDDLRNDSYSEVHFDNFVVTEP